MSQVEQLAIPEWTLGWRLQRSLAYANVSVQEMADELDVSRGTISRWCNDHNRPRRSDLRIWALRTGVPLDWLLHGDQPVTNPDIPSGISASGGYTPVDNEITRARKRIAQRLPLRGPVNPLALILRMAS